MSNHLLRELGVGFGGQGSVVKDSSAFPTAPRSRRAQCGVGGGQHNRGRSHCYHTWNVV